MTTDTVSIRCLSLTQPWAHLVACGRKTIETRMWSTRYRGDVLILSTRERSLDIDYLSYYTYDIHPTELLYGHALCVARLVDCRPMRDGDYERALVHPEPGRFAWELEDIRRITPFPMRGMQGLFTRTVERRLLPPIAEPANS